MALKLGTINKSRAYNTNTGTENVAVMIAEVHLADQAKKTPNVTEDYAIGYLMGSALGIEAKFNEENQPLTTVRVKMSPRTLSGEHTPMEIFDLQTGKKKGVSAAMGEFPVIIFERSYLDHRTDTIMAGWIKVAQRAYDKQDEFCLADAVISVDRERWDEKNQRNKQDRTAVHVKDAVTVNSFETLDAAIHNALADSGEAWDRRFASGANKPYALIRIVDNEMASVAEKADEMATQIIYPGWDKEAKVNLSIAETIERWKSDDSEERVEFMGALESVFQNPSGYTVEVIPVSRYNTGELSLPSMKKKGFDDSENFKHLYKKEGETVFKNSGEPVMVSGFGPGSMLLRLNTQSDKPDWKPGWFSVGAFKTDRNQTFLLGEVVTPNLPEDIAKLFATRAAARAKEVKEMFNKQREANKNASHSADDEIPFGEPDHSGGLTPS